MVAAVTTSLVIIVGIGIRLYRPASQAVGRAETSDKEGTARRQVHFVTPGGTRVIWTLSKDFDL
jgi:hypothetical protein